MVFFIGARGVYTAYVCCGYWFDRREYKFDYLFYNIEKHNQRTSMSVNISKKQFLSNVSDYCWAGNRHSSITDEDGVRIYEPVCSTYTRWLERWVTAFNATNDNVKVALTVCRGFHEDDYYRGYLIKRINHLAFPSFDNIQEEVYTITAEQAEDLGEVCKASVVEEEEEEPGSPYGSLTPELAHQIVAGYLVGK